MYTEPIDPMQGRVSTQNEYSFWNPEAQNYGMASFAQGYDSPQRKQLEDPNALYNKYMLNMRPDQKQYYKYNFSDVYQGFLKDFTTQNAGRQATPYEDDFTNYLGNYDWGGNDKYKLFGKQDSNQYNFVSPSLNWY